MNLTQQAGDFFSNVLRTDLWPPRLNSGTWSDFHSWLFISSDLVIWLAFLLIPVILAYFIYKKRVDNPPFKHVVVLFIVFILACGFTHLLDAAIFWWPAYNLSALLRFITAAVSLFTVFSLFKVMPHVVELKSPEALERLVDERTRALKEANDQLNDEIMKRKHISESLRASNDELLTFSYSVSHDLRAPLRSIHGFSHALLEDYTASLDDEGKDHLRRICSASSRMGELIDDMLKLSKISRNEVVVEDIDLSIMVQEIISSQIQRNPSIRTSFEIESDLKVRGDHKLMKIALENLIDNAIKYSSKVYSPVVRFGRKRGENTLFVQDNGAGFDMQFADKLFGAFPRLHDGTEFEGSGIGLATVKRIMLKHGGKIWAEARPKEGATFYFSI